MTDQIPGPRTYCGSPDHWRPDCPEIIEETDMSFWRCSICELQPHCIVDTGYSTKSPTRCPFEGRAEWEEIQPPDESRVQIKDSWHQAGRCGATLGPPVDAGQSWTPVLWDDEPDPDWIKTAALEPESVTEQKQDADAIAQIRAWKNDSLTYDASIYLADRLEQLTRTPETFRLFREK